MDPSQVSLALAFLLCAVSGCWAEEMLTFYPIKDSVSDLSRSLVGVRVQPDARPFTDEGGGGIRSIIQSPVNLEEAPELAPSRSTSAVDIGSGGGGGGGSLVLSVDGRVLGRASSERSEIASAASLRGPPPTGSWSSTDGRTFTRHGATATAAKIAPFAQAAKEEEEKPATKKDLEQRFGGMDVSGLPPEARFIPVTLITLPRNGKTPLQVVENTSLSNVNQSSLDGFRLLLLPGLSNQTGGGGSVVNPALPRETAALARETRAKAASATLAPKAAPSRLTLPPNFAFLTAPTPPPPPPAKPWRGAEAPQAYDICQSPAHCPPGHLCAQQLCLPASTAQSFPSAPVRSFSASSSAQHSRGFPSLPSFRPAPPRQTFSAASYGPTLPGPTSAFHRRSSSFGLNGRFPSASFQSVSSKRFAKGFHYPYRLSSTSSAFSAYPPGLPFSSERRGGGLTFPG